MHVFVQFLFVWAQIKSEERYFANMYHSTTEDKVKDETLHSVSDPGGLGQNTVFAQ